MNARLPTRLDRYPAKMVSRLADRLIDRYACGASTLFDPFAGSGAILKAAKSRGIEVTGADLNPISALFASVKLDGFEVMAARRMMNRVLRQACTSNARFRVQWENKGYWFTARTVDKFEAIRGAIADLRLRDSTEKTAVLLSLSLAVRICSRADQRSPKPFISKQAISARKGRHFDPFVFMPAMLQELGTYYGKSTAPERLTRFIVGDLCRGGLLAGLPLQSCIITSPPYLNAQDYFRNFKLELYVLEGLLPFKVDSIKNSFIGTERGIGRRLPDQHPDELTDFPAVRAIANKSAYGEAIARRYFSDMRDALTAMAEVLEPNGVLVVVCGDNLIAGERVQTWKYVAKIVEELGLDQFDSFADPIKDRLLAPKRLGHIGLIKEEIVMAFKKGVVQ